MSYTRNIDYLHSKPESRLIPQKSEYAYKKEYHKFIKWMEEQKITDTHERVVLLRAKNSGRQCHFKIWLDCHKLKNDAA
jgi:hypothetical protein